MRIDIFDLEAKVVEKIELDKKIFDGKINDSLMHQAVVTYLTNQRKGTASTKTRADVRGGGRKPWRQKGTGRARVGSIRSPLWRGGGVIFGPKPREFYKELPKRMKALALKSALNAKLNDNELMVIKELKVPSYKTKEFFKIVKNLKLNGERIRFVVENLEKNIKLSSGNLEKVEIEAASSLNTYTVLDCKKLIFTKDALKEVEQRIKKWIK
ncbi:MAG TPA: 50S ribosomal protein L4 [Candidatus Omnitrophica bacterium]|nr:50S ribosomal protein L4 [Candidatus Omnitrophota bacterium]